MSKKVLVIDDSDTIQKVIRITLASEPVEIMACKTMEELDLHLSEHIFSLILLDYNFSEKTPGSALAKRLTSHYPMTPIIAMLGAFDSVSSEELEESGVVDKLVKPFESSKFLMKCRLFLADEESEFEVEKTDKKLVSSALPLASHEWEYEVPPVIGGLQDEDLLVPPKVEGHDTLDSSSREIEEEIIFETQFEPVEVAPQAIEMGTTSVTLPSEDDLAYPDQSEITSEISDSVQLGRHDDFDEFTITPLTTSKFVPLDELVAEEELVEESLTSDRTEPGYSISMDLESPLEKEIRAEISPDEFWAVDEELNIGQKSAEGRVAVKVTSFTPEVTSSSILKTESPQPLEIQSKSMQEITQQMKEELLPEIDKMVSRYMQAYAKEIAWDVVSKVVEDVIAKEVDEIKKSVLSSRGSSLHK